MPARCRILGLDPGSQRTGYGILDCTAAGERHVANGCINVTGGALSARLRRIFEPQGYRLIAPRIIQHMATIGPERQVEPQPLGGFGEDARLIARGRAHQQQLFANENVAPRHISYHNDV